MKNKLIDFFKKAWEYCKQAKMELILLFSLLFTDLISKGIVAAAMELYDSVTLIPKLLHITYIHNDGAAFGSRFGLEKILGDTGVMVFFIVLTLVAVCFFSYFMFKNRGGHKLCRAAFALIIAGAMGNLVDRVLYGYVRDFIQFEYLGLEIFGSTTFAIFNIADAALCIGVVLFAVYYIFIYKEPKKDESKAQTDKTQSEETQGGENGNA